MPTSVWPVTISQQRSRWNAVPGHPPIRRREQWGAVHDYSRGRTCTSPATRVFIHISVTNPDSYRGNDAHAQAIERIGRARFGTSPSNTGISYNFGIMPNAALYEFQPAGRRGAHTVNDHGRSTCTRWGRQCPGYGASLTAPSGNLNYNARAFVICQNVNDPVTDAQIDTLARAIVCSYRAGLITRHAAHHPHGHRCVSSKSCPGDRMWARMDDLHARIHHYLDHGLVESEEEEDMPTAREIAEELVKVRVPNRALGEEDATVELGTLLSYVHEDTYQINTRQPRIESKVDAVIDDQAGLDSEAIKQHITEEHERSRAERAEQERRFNAALADIAERDEQVLSALRQIAEGGPNVDAQAVAREMMSLFHDVTAPQEGDTPPGD